MIYISMDTASAKLYLKFIPAIQSNNNFNNFLNGQTRNKDLSLSKNLKHINLSNYLLELAG